MIRNVDSRARFTYRRLAGVSIATSFNPLSAGISAGVSLASAAIGDWMQSIQQANMGKSGATAVANQMASQLNNLKAAYFAETNVTCADQRAALDAFDGALVWFQSPAGCGNPVFGSAGDRCISERVGAGAIYSYVDAIRTPIANDPRLAGLGCDTGNAVFLPSLTTGGYQQTTVADPSTQLPAGYTVSTAQPTDSNLLVYVALGIGLIFLVKS